MIFKTDMAGDTPYKKFMFDTDFDELAERRERARAKAEADEAAAEAAELAPEPEPEPEAPTFTEEEVARARDEGLAEGRRLGAEETTVGIDKQVADALSTIAQQSEALFTAQRDANREVTTQAVAVASALVRKLFPTLNEQTALDQVQSMLEATLGQATSEPSIIVRVPADLAEALHERVEALAGLSGFQGELKVLGDPALNLGDCRLEWSSGGVQRSAEELARQLDEIVQRNLDETQAQHPAPESATQDAATETVETAAEPEAAAEAEAGESDPASPQESAAVDPAPAAEVTEQPAPETAADPLPEPAAEAAPEASVEPAATPATETAMEPAVQPAMQPATEDLTGAETQPEPGAPVPSSQLLEEAAAAADLDAATPQEASAAEAEHAPVPSSAAMHEAPPEAEPEEAAEAAPAEEENDDNKYINPELLEILEAQEAEEEAKD